MTPTQALPILETLRDCRPSDTLAHQALTMAIEAIRGLAFDEARADVIASNGNDGEHYAELTPTPFRGRVTRRDA